MVMCSQLIWELASSWTSQGCMLLIAQTRKYLFSCLCSYGRHSTPVWPNGLHILFEQKRKVTAKLAFSDMPKLNRTGEILKIKTYENPVPYQAGLVSEDTCKITCNSYCLTVWFLVSVRAGAVWYSSEVVCSCLTIITNWLVLLAGWKLDMLQFLSL